VEFGLSILTLRKALAKNAAEPDSGGPYTTRQIGGAVYGGALSEEKLRTQRQMTRKLELENSITEASVLNRDAPMKGLSAIADAPNILETLGPQTANVVQKVIAI